MTFRGDNPCDVLMIGEGPNRSDDFFSIPFSGSAGQCLSDIVHVCFDQHCDIHLDGEADVDFTPSLSPEEAADKSVYALMADYTAAIRLQDEVHRKYPSLKVGYSNLVACLPLGVPEVEGGLKPIRPPEKEEAEACRGRLLELIHIVKPRAIVVLGKVPAKLIPKHQTGLPDFVEFVEEIMHPSALLRLQSEDHLRYLESRNRILLTLTRAKRRLWGLEK